ncbi:ferritin-like domain-containing protein [Streptosporangium amethystogenes]|uniref:ferritin-like domain-containing protein n=1 Tax=Streptosporangium amethystogenes TaxID=2002 RepID=UPI000A047AC7|nr:ferritin-like domain-containing protein [Streptosporangium amethystogenes]
MPEPRIGTLGSLCEHLQWAIELEHARQFYAAIEQGLRYLCETLGEKEVFCGDPARQVSDGHFRHTGGRLVAVTDLASALDALEEIVEQGEGTARGEVWDGDQDEVAHYYRFMELKLGRRYRRGDTPESGPTGEKLSVDLTGVFPMTPNPADRAAQEEFNHTYCAILHLLELAFNGSPRILAVATGEMYALKAQAQGLMRRGGLTFEYVPPELRRWSAGDHQRIVVLRDGPYVVYGRVPLRRKRKIVSAEQRNALTWKTGEPLETEETYALCRCGHSGAKPFCDGTHAVIDFDGTEAAPMRPYQELQHVHDGVGISAQRVGELCVHAASASAGPGPSPRCSTTPPTATCAPTSWAASITAPPAPTAMPSNAAARRSMPTSRAPSRCWRRRTGWPARCG